MLGHRYPLGSKVRLTQQGIDNVRASFGSITGLNDVWVVTAQTYSTLFSTYTITSVMGTHYQGCKEEMIEYIGH
ncbi:hypothetical protein D9619_001595 [Psilocybe cf. subviscida]|uniref:Uncharacterized protein n=1 Tax=Psilocybe cf. subviscida TaxID=2480587 RepID=A0A8H5BDL3_9AGAR|nr:hypothetical protein D9619_001595 [Psilocybe cf. subviscida]